MSAFKLAIKWEDGSVLGILAEATDQEEAQREAYRQLYRSASSRGQGFRIIPLSDVSALPEDEKDKIRTDWYPSPNPMMYLYP